jgi:hypothetical protein
VDHGSTLGPRPGAGKGRVDLPPDDIAAHRRFVETWEPVAKVSMHALGRFFERSGMRDHDALVAALAGLVGASAEMERVPAAGGVWLGDVVRATHNGQDKGSCLIRNVRTWLAV